MGRIMRALILSSVLSTSALIRKASASSYAQMETLFVKAANGDDYESEFKFHVIRELVSKETVVLSRWGRETQNFGFIN